MNKIKTYEFTYNESIDGFGGVQFCDETEQGATKLFQDWQKENGYNIEEYNVEDIYDANDAEEYGIRYARNPERAKLLHCILLNIGENFYYSGESENGKAFAITDSEVAADALLETLYNLGFEEEGNPDTTEPDYRREEVFVNGFMCYKFTEL